MGIEFVKQIKYSDSFISECAVYDSGKSDKMMPIIFSFYLIKVNNELLLVDVGCDTMSGFQMNNYLMPDEALKKEGINPDDIKKIIITHSDHDHIDGIHHFKNAVIYIQNDEYKIGKKYILDNQKVITFDNEIIVDDEIKVLKIAGHHIGSCIVEFNYNNKPCVIAGDECYSNYNIKKKVPTASSYNKQNSINFINKYTDGRYELLLMHEVAELL